VTTFIEPGDAGLIVLFSVVLPISILGRSDGKGPIIHAYVQRVLRLKFDHQLTNREIAKSCAISHVTVGKYLEMARQAGISWPLPDGLDDARLEQQLYADVTPAASDKPAMPPMQYLFKELKKKHVTLQLLWYEYKQNNPDGYQYSYFCELYQPWVCGG
jgi:hypothetical protein